MSRMCTDYWVVEIDEMLSMGFSTRHIAARLNIPHETLLKVLEERKKERDKWQEIINEQYKGKNILER